jgi:predicted dehydrogenase
MLGDLAAIAAACDLTIPAAHRRRIGIVGAGAIVEVAHLPAYRLAGLEVVAILDLDRARAEDLATRFGIARVHDSLDDLLADPAVELVDIAVPAVSQPAIALQALEAGHHLICQKPFAVDVATARTVAAAARRLGRHVAVQQQLRFEEGIAAARAMVRAGWIGDPIGVTFAIDILTDFTAWPWLVESDRLELMYHSIHYFDAIRSILGDPVRVFGTQARRPGQAPRAETRTASILVYPGDIRAVVNVNHENVSGANRAEFQVDGTSGTIRGTLGLDYDYPRGRPDTLEVWSSSLPTDGWLPYPVTTRWIPDAFIGPVRSLLAAIAEGGEAETSVRDNLGTLKIVEALYRSGATGEAQAIEPESEEDA